jgi:hypothetical protein
MKLSTFMRLFVPLALSLALVTVVVAGSASRQTVAQRHQLNFSHKFHVEDNGVDCQSCHTTVAKSVTGRDDLLPGHTQCAECHDIQAPDNCAMCHSSATPKERYGARITDYSALFNHQVHLDKAKLACTVCHQNLDQPLPSDEVGHLPGMPQCMTCHEQRNASLECATCHTPDESVTPQDHLVNWLTRHGAEGAAEQDSRCAMCHGRIASPAPDCQSCHNGDQVFFPHPRNYISRHGQDAHLSDLRCATCHDVQNDCNACHRQLNVLPAGHYRPGWVTSDGGEHSTQAQFDLESCMSCHDSPKQEPVCVRCHGK